MHFTSTTLLALLGAVSALPSPNTPRASITAVFYPEPNFQGEPTYMSGLPNNKCTKITEGIVVGSFSVESGALCRLTYNSDTCSAHGDVIVFPDTPVADLSGKNVSHLLCQECSNC